MRDCGCHSHNGFRLSPEGLAQREVIRPGVDNMDMFEYLDSTGSVSGLELERDSHMWPIDEELLEQGERFLNGS